MTQYDLMKGTFDFKDVLAEQCLTLKPRRILEWGPGYSSQLMHECCPKAEIISIEHDEKWYNKAIEKHGKYATIYLVPLNGKPSKYSTWPLLQKFDLFDLIFIDGRQRLSCLIVASQILNSSGRIILHDAKRLEYKPAIDVLKQLGFFVEGERTKVITRNRLN